MAIITSFTPMVQLGLALLVAIEGIALVSGKYVEDGAPSFQAMQSISPFIKSVFADSNWEESSIAMNADDAFSKFLTSNDSTILFAGRTLQPSDYVNAGCSCASEGCTQEVINGNALISCNDVTPLKIELTAERTAVIVNKDAEKYSFSYEDLLAYYTASEPIPCSVLGGDAKKTVSFYTPSDATAVGFHFRKYIQSKAYEDPIPGQAVKIESSFDNIIQKVGSDQCAIGLVPYAMAKDCQKYADSMFALGACGNLKISKLDGVVCDVCPPSGSTYALDSPVLLYMNINTVQQNEKVDIVLEKILQKAVDYNFDLFDTLPQLKNGALLNAQRNGCMQMNTFTTDSFFVPPPMDRFCDTILCCYVADACDSDWYTSTFHFNLSAMFANSPCPECQAQAQVDSIPPDVCTVSYPECTNDIMEECYPGQTTAPITVCMMCGYPNDVATERVCMQTYVYFDIAFNCVDQQNQVLDYEGYSYVDPCARGDCSILDLDLDFVTGTINCVPAS